MTDLIITAAVPIFTIILALLFRGSGKKGLFCFLFGILMFLPAAFGNGAGYDRLVVIFESGAPDTPIGLKFLIRLASYFTDDARALIYAVSALCAICAAVSVRSFCKDVYAGAAIYAACGFVFIQTADISLYIAAMLCLFAAQYIREIRFFRFAAVIFLAACFDITALLMLPLFFAAQIRLPWITWLISIAGAALLIAFPCGDYVFGFLSDTPRKAYEIPTACIVIIAAFAIIGTLVCKLFGKGNRDAVTNLNLMILGCFAAAVSYTDGRFAPLVLLTAMPSVTALGSEMFAVGLKLTERTFKASEGGEKAVAVWHALCVGTAVAIFAAVLLSGAFGIASYSTTFFKEAL